MFKRLLPRFNTTIAGNADTSGSNATAQQAVDTANAALSYDPTVTAGAAKASLGTGEGTLGGLLGGETSDYVNQYAAQVAKNPTVTQLYQTGNQLYNVPQLAQTATNLSNRLTNLTPNAYIGAKGYDIDATDINNGIAQSSAYLTPQSNAATANYNTAAGLASQYVTAGQAQNMQNLLAIQAKGSLLAQQEAAQATGWNNTLSNEFNALVAKMNAGITLSGEEMTRANQLATLEENYQSAVSSALIGQQYQNVAAGNTLVNTFQNPLTMVNPSKLTAATGVATVGKPSNATVSANNSNKNLA